MTRYFNPNRDDRHPFHSPPRDSSWNPLIKRRPRGPETVIISFHFSYLLSISSGIELSCLATRRCSWMIHIPYKVYILCLVCQIRSITVELRCALLAHLERFVMCYFTGGIFRSLQILFARISLISVCRGTAERVFNDWLCHHECLLPSRSNSHPCSRIWRSNLLRFIKR